MTNALAEFEDLEIDVDLGSAVGVDEDEFDEAVSEKRGWCAECREFTTDSVEPRAVGAVCAHCGAENVRGAAAARAGGFVMVSREVLS